MSQNNPNQPMNQPGGQRPMNQPAVGAAGPIIASSTATVTEEPKVEVKAIGPTCPNCGMNAGISLWPKPGTNIMVKCCAYCAHPRD